MTCPRCHAEIIAESDSCPDCGLRLVKRVSGVMKTSAVMIAAGEEHSFYRSVQEVPEPLRTQLINSTQSANSGMILIADRAGKEQLTQVIARRAAAAAAAAESKEEPASIVVETQPEEQPEQRPELFGVSWLAWSGMLLVLVLAVIIAAAFGLRW